MNEPATETQKALIRSLLMHKSWSEEGRNRALGQMEGLEKDTAADWIKRICNRIKQYQNQLLR